MTKENNFFTVSGTAYWAQVHTPSKQFDKYQITVALDDEKKFISDILKPFGVASDFKKDKDTKEYSKDDQGRRMFVFRKNATSQKGDVLKKPKVVDAKGNEIPSSVLIGNGSKVNVCFVATPRIDKLARAGQHKLNLVGVQVTELVEYTSGGSMFEATEGYTVDDSVTFEIDSSPLTGTDD